MSASSGATRPCPCPECKKHNLYQTPRTIWNHCEAWKRKEAQEGGTSLQVKAELLDFEDAVVVESPSADLFDDAEVDESRQSAVPGDDTADSGSVAGSPSAAFPENQEPFASADDQVSSPFGGSSPEHSPPGSPGATRDHTHPLDEELRDENEDDDDDDDEPLPGPQPAGYETDEDDDRTGIDGDPDFRRNDAYARNAHRAALDADEPQPLPRAFAEHPAIRNAYVHAFVLGAFQGGTHDQVKSQLIAQKNSLLDALAHVEDTEDTRKLRDDLAKMAMTLRSVEKRLGVDPDRYLVYYALCPTCWQRYPVSELDDLEMNRCTRTGCSAKLFETKRTASRGVQRYPLKVLAYYPLTRALRLFFRRPGKWEECQAWRKEGDHWQQDEPRPPPMSYEEWRDGLREGQLLSDIHDGWIWRLLRANMKRVWRPETREVDDVDVENLNLRFVSLPCGLVFGIFVDWLQVRKRGAHSAGAIILSIQNLPRSIRYLRENLFLLMTIPGPSEPDTEGMNRLMDLIVEELLSLEEGILCDVYGHDEREPVHGTCPFTTSDTPARLKTAGFVSQNTDEHLCYVCGKTFPSLTQAHCFDRDTFRACMHDPIDLLTAKFTARDAAVDGDMETVKEMKKDYGVHYSVFDTLPNWHIPLCVPLEPMHNLSGIIGDIYKTILLNGGMFTSTGKRNAVSPLDKMQTWLEALWIPGTMGRLSTSIVSGGGRPKCDDWRNFMTVLPVGLAIAWNMWDREPGDEAPLPQKRTKVKAETVRTENLLHKRRRKALARDADHDIDDLDLDDIEDIKASRDYHKHYMNVLRVCTAIRMLWTRSTCREDIELAQDYLCHAFQSWAIMGCHLKPNFHIACHGLEWLEAFGTFYSFSVWAYERCMGILSKFKTNGRTGGELECTFMRAWWKTILCQDLIRHMQDLEDGSPGDKAAIDALLTAMRGGAEAHRQRGTLLNYLASVSQDEAADPVQFPSYKAKVNIRDMYDMLLDYARTLWPHARIKSDRGMSEGDLVFYPWQVSAYPTVRVRGVKYGASTHPHGEKQCYGYIEGRRAVRIEYILSIALTEELTSNVAIVRRFETDERIPSAPWDLWEGDLGIQMWARDLADIYEVQPLEKMSGLFAMCVCTLPGLCTFRITISLDHERAEAEA
ncbi:hypothetical protein PENSPDRAFT_758171 [Peniophora sp. CONT]|nr:hypothetical protein PENSPDRAFT_758171 [Peniophora sp. CONT]